MLGSCEFLFTASLLSDKQHKKKEMENPERGIADNKTIDRIVGKPELSKYIKLRKKSTLFDFL